MHTECWYPREQNSNVSRVTPRRNTLNKRAEVISATIQSKRVLILPHQLSCTSEAELSVLQAHTHTLKDTHKDTPWVAVHSQLECLWGQRRRYWGKCLNEWRGTASCCPLLVCFACILFSHTNQQVEHLVSASVVQFPESQTNQPMPSSTDPKVQFCSVSVHY